MSHIRFHLDEDTEAHALVQALRSRGIDVTTTAEAGLTEISDSEQVGWAFKEGRVLVTYNAADFYRLHAALVSMNQHHAGIVIAEQQRLPVGEMMRRLLRLRSRRSAESMQDRVEFLNHWQYLNIVPTPLRFSLCVSRFTFHHNDPHSTQIPG